MTSSRLPAPRRGSSSRSIAPSSTPLGIPNRIGFTQTSASGHCVFPGSQAPDVKAFVDKFLLGQGDVDTNIEKSPYDTDLSPWITWDTPTLK